MVDRHVQIGSFSTSTIAARNQSCPKEEHCQILSKNKEKKLASDSLREELGFIKWRSKEKSREIIEVEVFMPIVDVEQKAIIYPDSKKPIIKRHYANENKDVLKSKKNLNKIVLPTQKNDEFSSKKSHLRIKKDFREKSNKNISKPGRKLEEANTVKNSSIRTETSGRDLVLGNAEDLGDEEVDSVEFQKMKVIRNDIGNLPYVGELKCREKVADNLPLSHMDRTPSDYADKAADNLRLALKSEWKKKTANKLSLPRTGTAPECANTSHMETDAFRKPVFKKVPCESKTRTSNPIQNYRKIHELVYCPVTKVSVEPGYKVNPETSINIVKIKPDAFVQRKNKGENNQVKKINLSFEKVCRELKAEKLPPKPKESNSSINETLNKIRSNQNGWRRIIPVDSARKTSGISKWRRKTDDGLSMQCWIERSQHLLNRNQQLQKTPCGNPWRTS